MTSIFDFLIGVILIGLPVLGIAVIAMSQPWLVFSVITLTFIFLLIIVKEEK